MFSRYSLGKQFLYRDVENNYCLYSKNSCDYKKKSIWKFYQNNKKMHAELDLEFNGSTKKSINISSNVLNSSELELQRQIKKFPLNLSKNMDVEYSCANMEITMDNEQSVKISAILKAFFFRVGPIASSLATMESELHLKNFLKADDLKRAEDLADFQIAKFLEANKNFEFHLMHSLNNGDMASVEMLFSQARVSIINSIKADYKLSDEMFINPDIASGVAVTVAAVIAVVVWDVVAVATHVAVAISVTKVVGPDVTDRRNSLAEKLILAEIYKNIKIKFIL